MELSEAISKSSIDRVTLCLPLREEIKGRLSLGGHHLIFSAISSGSDAQTPSKQLKSFANQSNNNEFTILHRCVDCVISEASSGKARLTLKCKHFLEIGLFFTTIDDCNAVARSIHILSNLNDIQLEYPFYYTCPFPVLENGWEAFTEEVHFSSIQFVTDMFRISNVNKEFRTCASYPEKVLVPKSVTDDVITSSASFREGARFPVLAYFHKQTNSCLIRSSEPLVGTGNRRCIADEQLLNAYLPSVARGFIIDTRTLTNAQNAKSRGGGFEQEMFYSRWKRVHKPIPRWQALQESLTKLIQACSESSTDRWLSKLAGSGWLQCVSDVITCACVCAQCIDREDTNADNQPEVSVVVHGGEGVDTTLLVTSLTQIILHPDARTMRGFESVIEGEWVNGGHPFRSRCTHSAYTRTKPNNNSEAPTFLLFLDCVWQIWRQFPESFEFGESFLVHIFEHSYFSEFGTFLCDSEKERQRLMVKENTVSLWSYLNRADILNKYMNPYYEPNKVPIWPSVAPQSLCVWERVYMAWNVDWSEQDEALKIINQAKIEEKANMIAVARCRRQVKELEREILNAELGSAS